MLKAGHRREDIEVKHQIADDVMMRSRVALRGGGARIVVVFDVEKLTPYHEEILDAG